MINKIVLGIFILGVVIFTTLGKTQHDTKISTVEHQNQIKNAQPIHVKYRGVVDVANGHFEQLDIGSSSYVHNMFYDEGNQYLLVQLKDTYYHYCSIPQSVVSDWTSSSSLGKFYNLNIKGNYDCRINPVPTY